MQPMFMGIKQCTRMVVLSGFWTGWCHRMILVHRMGMILMDLKGRSFVDYPGI